MPFATSRRRPGAVLLIVVALLAVAFTLRAAPAHADQSQLSIMMDDNLLVYTANNQARYDALEQMHEMGVQVVRATLLWSAVAKGTKNPATHSRFDPTNPADYPRGAWTNYDDLVADAAAAGIAVYFDVTGPGPSWAMGKTTDPTEKPSYMPNVGQFANFVRAVGTRYSGTYTVRYAGANHVMPAVKIWSIWNEPNQVGWLSPQGVYNKRIHAVLPYSPILYRRIFYAASSALAQTGHSSATGNTVLAGETAPLGSPPQNGRTPMRPAQFIREFFCVNSHLQPYTGVQASVRGCSFWNGRGPLPASGWAHHPYTKAEPPTWRDKSPDSIVMANISSLPKLLDRIAANTNRVAGGLPIWITEMGYETNPPDPFRGVSEANQATYDNETDFMAYEQPRVAAVTQFLLEDAAPDTQYKKGTRGYWSTYQSGLEWGPGSGHKVGSHKPAYDAYELPIWVRTISSSSGPELELWAWPRFTVFQAPSSYPLVFQFKAQGSQSWVTEGTVQTATTSGFVDTTLPDTYGPGVWKAVVPLGSGLYLNSRSATAPQ